MNIRITKELFDATGGEGVWRKFGLFKADFGWERYKEIDIRPMTSEQREKIIEIIKPQSDMRGVKNQIYNIQTWEKAIKNPSKTKPINVKQFHSLLLEELKNVPGHRVYRRESEGEGVEMYRAYYINHVDYYEKKKYREYTEPARVEVILMFMEFSERSTVKLHFRARDIQGYTAMDAFLQTGYIPETPELRAEYLEQKERYDTYSHEVGKQFEAIGEASDDMDGNPNSDDEERRWWWKKTNNFTLERDGEPARVVIDVYRESDKNTDRHARDNRPDPSFWEAVEARKPLDVDDEDDNWEVDDEENGEAAVRPGDPEVPIHFTVPIFDLKRHLRMKIDMSQLVEHKYDKTLGTKLILPNEVTSLVDMLVEHKGKFKDIIGSKGGGSIILCSGPPGTGKTLTAEVYSEVMERPLYTVQCSQLGVTATKLEEELMKVFARSQRWNAILLLDEADVYVHRRGSDLGQNAIVGVFLRVLEYYNGVLFLTTNRQDLVDDAIASRCIAKIVYDIPKPVDQERIWGILSTVSGVKIEKSVIKQVVNAYPHMTGRDIKNLVKLASLVESASGEPITFETIKFVKQFKPTADLREMGGSESPYAEAKN